MIQMELKPRKIGLSAAQILPAGGESVRANRAQSLAAGGAPPAIAPAKQHRKAMMRLSPGARARKASPSPQLGQISSGCREVRDA